MTPLKLSISNATILKYPLQSSIMLLESSIMLLELSIKLLKNIYSSGITDDDRYMMIVICFLVETTD